MRRAINYFESEWRLKNRNWYEGAKVLAPSTNNALESFNRVIMVEHSFRERLELRRFLFVTYEMIETWSNDYRHKIQSFAFFQRST